jgi:4-hydroxy-2-oxoheptanedioate aldolase
MAPTNGTDSAINTVHYHSEGQTMVVVRVPEGDLGLLNTVLDYGADGIIFPHCETAEEVAALSKQLYYPPQGTRSFSPWVQTSLAGAPSLYPGDANGTASANRHVACIAQIESVKGIENVDEIAALEGVHGVMFGPTDFLFDAGVPMFESPGVPHPTFQQALGAVAAAGKKHGKPLVM